MNIVKRLCFALVVSGIFLTAFVGKGFAQSPAALDGEQWFKKADAELNQVYGEITKKLHGKKERADFIKSQKAWLAFRDADASFRAGVTGGGSAYTTDYLANLSELTETRTKKLREFLKTL